MGKYSETKKESPRGKKEDIKGKQGKEDRGRGKHEFTVVVGWFAVDQSSFGSFLDSSPGEEKTTCYRRAQGILQIDANHLYHSPDPFIGQKLKGSFYRG